MIQQVKNISAKRALTIAEAATYACVSRGTIEKWLARGLLPYEELPSGGSGVYSFKRIRKADLDAFLDQSYHQQSYDNDNEPEIHAENKLILLPRNT